LAQLQFRLTSPARQCLFPAPRRWLMPKANAPQDIKAKLK
jgi:hypothetical protein